MLGVDVDDAAIEAVLGDENGLAVRGHELHRVTNANSIQNREEEHQP
ncbi:hypothetical protein [Arthrobacter globiformis]|nr:hypothetical protein [Arthrobacter globiformis]